jgi:hypothetical protein
MSREKFDTIRMAYAQEKYGLTAPELIDVWSTEDMWEICSRWKEDKSEEIPSKTIASKSLIHILGRTSIHLIYWGLLLIFLSISFDLGVDYMNEEILIAELGMGLLFNLGFLVLLFITTQVLLDKLNKK